MNDMNELCTIENFFKFVNFNVSTDKAAQPIICDDNRWENL